VTFDDRAHALEVAGEQRPQSLGVELLSQLVEEAEGLAREAVTIGDQTDMANAQAASYADLSEVPELAGRSSEARAALEQALEIYERKGNVVMAKRMRARLQGLL
jgi:hypothetical protein